MKNKLGYFGFLGLVGLLGLGTNNTGFFGFFGFFAYFRYFNVIPDELFKENVRRAATPSFFVSIATTALTFIISDFLKNPSILLAGFGISFALSVIIFPSILLYFEIKEGKGE